MCRTPSFDDPLMSHYYVFQLDLAFWEVLELVLRTTNCGHSVWISGDLLRRSIHFGGIRGKQVRRICTAKANKGSHTLMRLYCCPKICCLWPKIPWRENNMNYWWAMDRMEFSAYAQWITLLLLFCSWTNKMCHSRKETPSNVNVLLLPSVVYTTKPRGQRANTQMTTKVSIRIVDLPQCFMGRKEAKS